MTNIIKNGLEEVNTSIGQLLEAINNKADLDASNISGSSFESFIENKFNEILASIDYVIESKLPTDDDPSWYRLYKSGWIEQGGKITTTSVATVTFTKQLNNLSYIPYLTVGETSEADVWGDKPTVITSSLTTSSMKIYLNPRSGGYPTRTVWWQVSGQSA